MGKGDRRLPQAAHAVWDKFEVASRTWDLAAATTHREIRGAWPMGWVTGGCGSRDLAWSMTTTACSFSRGGSGDFVKIFVVDMALVGAVCGQGKRVARKVDAIEEKWTRPQHIPSCHHNEVIGETHLAFVLGLELNGALHAKQVVCSALAGVCATAHGRKVGERGGAKRRCKLSEFCPDVEAEPSVSQNVVALMR